MTSGYSKRISEIVFYGGTSIYLAYYLVVNDTLYLWAIGAIVASSVFATAVLLLEDTIKRQSPIYLAALLIIAFIGNHAAYYSFRAFNLAALTFLLIVLPHRIVEDHKER